VVRMREVVAHRGGSGKEEDRGCQDVAVKHMP
jgi:hypothetical protein